MKLNQVILPLASLFLSYSTVHAFVPQRRMNAVGGQAPFNVNTFHQGKSLIDTTTATNSNIPKAIQNQRKSCASVQTMSFFGLGGLEIGVILIAVFFLLGPQKLAEMGRDAGKAASDFRDVPKEFQRGYEEGEIEARSRNAKQMEETNDDSD